MLPFIRRQHGTTKSPGRAYVSTAQTGYIWKISGLADLKCVSHRFLLLLLRIRVTLIIWNKANPFSIKMNNIHTGTLCVCVHTLRIFWRFGQSLGFIHIPTD